MIATITSTVMKPVPYVRPVIQSVEIALDAKEIIESFISLGAAKIISGGSIKGL